MRSRGEFANTFRDHLKTSCLIPPFRFSNAERETLTSAVSPSIPSLRAPVPHASEVVWCSFREVQPPLRGVQFGIRDRSDSEMTGPLYNYCPRQISAEKPVVQAVSVSRARDETTRC